MIPTGGLRSSRGRTRRQALITGVVMLLLAALIAVGLLIVRTQPPLVPHATVETGIEASAAGAMPTRDEVALAQRVLGTGLIAYITCNQTSEYHATQAREMGDFAKAYGLAYRVYDSDTNPYIQITQIERARTDGARALIVCPLDVDLLAEPLKSAQDAGMPLVLMSADTPSFGGVMIVGDDYHLGYKAGQLAGQIITQEMGGHADVVILDFPDLPYIVIRANGLQDGVLSEAPDAHIVGRFRGATRGFGEESVSKLIDEGLHFDVIVSINDAGSFGAIDAMEEADIPPNQVVITSVDAEQLALRYIREGYYMRGSVEVGRQQFSRAAIDAVTKLLAGGTLPERILVPPGEIVTADSLSQTNGQ